MRKLGIVAIVLAGTLVGGSAVFIKGFNDGIIQGQIQLLMKQDFDRRYGECRPSSLNWSECYDMYKCICAWGSFRKE